MTTYLLNSIPNSLLIQWERTTVVKLTPEQAKELLTDNNFVSCIGHDNVAEKVSNLLEMKVLANRQAIEQLKKYDTLIVCLTITPNRKSDGSLWTAEELANMPLQWVKIYNSQPEWEDHEWRYQTTTFA